ncbi:MAG: hypothetical protein H7Y31_12565 [Chitinophagaceae bacterium]|nr:hypothetical protein [Chitinophagaceae bacterium]
MIAQYLWIAAGIPFIVLGTIHLVYTFFGSKLYPRDPSMIDEMKRSFITITRETTHWKVWIGFNASHSSGVMFIGIMTIYFGLIQYDLIVNSLFLQITILATMIFYVVIARKYWFSIPFAGTAIATILLVTSLLIMHVG